jgi:hypothetical protein
MLKPISGGELLGIFTQKNFTFINTKRNEFKQSLNTAIEIAGSK